jgi:collagen type III alpha
MFGRLDANGDGSISKDEAPERIRENFDRVDANGDGKISPDEFRAMMDSMRQRMGQGGGPGGGRPQDGGDRPDRPQRPQ